MNRRVRDPYARWCERRTSLQKCSGAAYSIVACGFSFKIVYFFCSFNRLVNIVKYVVFTYK